MQAYTKNKVKAMIAYNNAVISALERIEANGHLTLQQECELDSARVTLASLTAEPVAYIMGEETIDDFNRGYEFFAVRDAKDEPDISIVPLYTAPPAPALRLPDDLKYDDAPCHLDAYEADCWLNGASWMRGEVKRLNATAQSAPDYSECPLCDSSYIAGMQAGFKFGDAGDSEGFNKAVNSRRKQISDILNATAPQTVKLPDLSSLDQLAGKFLQASIDRGGRVSSAYSECAHMLATEVKAIRDSGYQVED